MHMPNCFPHTRRLIPAALIACLVLALAGEADAQRRSRNTAASSAVDEMVRMLALEASEMKTGHRFPGDEPDFASRTTLTADPEAIGRAIISTHHKDVLIDAYVRWQLTSFEDAKLPELDDRAFLQALRSLPRFLENPRAQGRTVALFERAEQSGRVTDRDRRRLEEMSSELETRSALVAPYNQPALGLRQWLLEQCGETGMRQHMVRIEWVAATITGGWPTRAIKTDMTKAMTAAADDETISRPDRMKLAGMIAELEGMSRQYIREVAFLADGSVEVGFSTVEVSKDDVKRWTDRLLGAAGASSRP